MKKIMDDTQALGERVTGGYQKIEAAVVHGYRKMEDVIVSGFGRVCDRWVQALFTREGETVDQAKARLSRKNEMI